MGMIEMTMIKERKSIWDEYRANRGVFETKMKEIAKCEGFGVFVGTGKYEMQTLWVRDMTMEEWDAKKAKRYKELTSELADYEAEKTRKAKVRRYKAELKEIEARMEFLKKWIAENDKKLNRIEERFEELFTQVQEELELDDRWDLYDSEDFDKVTALIVKEFGEGILESEEFIEWEYELKLNY